MARHAPTFLLLTWLATACGRPGTQVAPQIVSVYATSAAQPWLDEAYTCAAPSIVLELTDAATADVNLRLGAPLGLNLPSFQVGSDDLLVVVHPQTAVANLTRDQVRGLFSGQVSQWSEVGGADLPVVVWTYAPAEDVQMIFDRQLMQGQPIVSAARLAVSAQAMSDSVGADPGSIGILPRRWKAGNTDTVLTLSSVPVLAITAGPPRGAVRDLLSCLQSKE